MRVKLRSRAAVTALCLAAAAVFAAPAPAADPAAEFKAEIDGLLDKLEPSTGGLVKWDGAERMEFRQDGDAAIADIANARIAIQPHEPHPARVTLDRVEIRRAPGPDGALNFTIALPREAVLRGADREETRLTLKDPTADWVLDRQSGRGRELHVAIAGGRLEDKKTGDWITMGPLSLSSTVRAAADGGWETPLEFALKGIEFFFTEGRVGGALDRIGYTAHTAGPDLAALNRLRDKLDALRRQEDIPAAERREELINLLPKFYSLFSLAKGELTVDGLAVRERAGEPLMALVHGSIGGVLSGLSGDTAAWRITVRHQGLSLAPKLLEPGKVPRRAVADFGLENVATAPLRTIIEAAIGMGAGATEAEKQQAMQRTIGAAAMLDPVLRIYEFMVDTPDVGVEATGEAKGSPLSPKGYAARGDAAVRGIDALPVLLGAAPLADYLPLLKELGTAASAADGTPRLKFHLASAPPKWLTINGHDVTAWFAAPEPAGGPRILRPAAPPLTGADVRAVQRALAAGDGAVPQSGAYDGATAAAVARFQKKNGLNADGVVDAATRRKLGIAGEPGAAPDRGKGPN